MIALPKLPFNMDALSPYISGETLCFIHQKIMPSYVDALPTPKKPISFLHYLSKIEDGSIGYRSATELYHHGFWLYHIKPNGGGQPSDFMQNRILEDFGSFEKFRLEFLKHTKHPDTHWIWLAEQAGKLSVVATSTEGILSLGYKPIAVCNLCTHAYYLDYRDRKADYVNAYLEHLIDWQRAEMALTGADLWLWQSQS